MPTPLLFVKYFIKSPKLAKIYKKILEASPQNPGRPFFSDPGSATVANIKRNFKNNKILTYYIYGPFYDHDGLSNLAMCIRYLKQQNYAKCLR